MKRGEKPDHSESLEARGSVYHVRDRNEVTGEKVVMTMGWNKLPRCVLDILPEILLLSPARSPNGMIGRIDRSPSRAPPDRHVGISQHQEGTGKTRTRADFA